MATTKVTITLPDSQIEELRRRVACGESDSVSRFVQRAVGKSLENAAAYEAMIAQALAETGGPVTPKERAWARRMLTPRKRAPKAGKRRKAA